MAGKRRKHKPKYKPKEKPKVRQPEKAVQPPQPAFSEPPLIVFVSSLIDKMRNERAAVEQAVRSIPITRTWKFEDTPASSQPLEESYLSKVRTCDIFLIVLGSDYSRAVDREFETAVESQKPILAFVRTGKRDAEQNRLVKSINTKRDHYSAPSDLRSAVTGAIWDELIRAHRGYIRSNAAPQVIQQIPLPTPTPKVKVEDFMGYFIIGVDDPSLVRLFKAFGATDVPPDLEEQYPYLEPVPIVNVAEINTAVTAIHRANARSQNAHNRQIAFQRELRREAVELASLYIKRQHTKTPEPEISMPGVNYYIWGMEHNYARLIKLLRLEEYLKEAINVERTSQELLFKDAEHFVKVGTILDEANRKAAGDLEEFGRLLQVEAALFTLDDGIDETN
jgi:uncharacterized protein DUF4062